MELHIDYLKTFITLSEIGNFSRTGVLLNKSQSAVSMQIKRLEAETGRNLFTRKAKSAKLTGAGRILLHHARRIVKEHDEAVRALSLPDMTDTIRFGSPEHYTTAFLPRLLAQFSANYPEIVVEMHCKNSPQIKEDVASGKLDIGISSQILESEQVLANDPLVWVASPGFQLPTRGPIPLALFDEGCMFRSWATTALHKRHIDYRVVYISHSVSGLIEAVRAGLAIAPIVKNNVPDDLRILGAKHGLPPLPVTHIVLHQKKDGCEIVNSFAEHIVNTLSHVSG